MSLADDGFLILLRAIAIVNVLYGIPFIFKLVPPNRFFGFKMSSVLPDTDAWYYANRILGLGTLVSGLITGVVSLILPSFVSEYDRGTRVAVIMIAVIAPLTVAVMITRRAAQRRMTGE
jgi:uncharacterized membrane protein